MADTELRVLIIAEHASARFGGEAALPLLYFRLLRRRGVPAWLVVHERTRPELDALLPLELERMTFIADSAGHRVLWRVSQCLPARVAGFTTGFAMRLLTQLAQRRVVRRMVRDKRISVIHQPMPVSPREPSLVHSMGAPVIIGPMNGGIDFPPAFRHLQGKGERIALAAGRYLSQLMNWLLPGKRRAAMLLVANERTRNALPDGICRDVRMLVENGVDLTLWHPAETAERTPPSTTTRFTYVGRLVDWKAVDLLLHAFARAAPQTPMSLEILGDGDERSRLEEIARALGILGEADAEQAGKARFRGWMSQADCAARLQHSDALVLPSLMECGGAVVLEAMAMGVPVIATDWGGPADYLDASCGILVEPVSKQSFIEGLERALSKLAGDPQARLAMGRAGRARAVQHFDWERKVDHVLGLYRQVAARTSDTASRSGSGVFHA